MVIRQFEDKGLSHYSYAILSEGKIVLVDPERDPKMYFDFAEQNKAQIAAVMETHPHADFISSHAEIHRKTGADVYVSKLLSAGYPHKNFDDGDSFKMGGVEFKALNTPGHSPDSICIVAYEDGKPQALFSGDTLFIGDCGRPDLRENAGALTEARDRLARKMYHSLRDKLMLLPNDVKVYPTHGAGSLCGRGLSAQNVSTVGAEKISNWSLQPMAEEDFVHELISTQPFVPKYFTHSVDMNRTGGSDYEEGIKSVTVREGLPDELENISIIDTRPEDVYKRGSLPGSINLMKGGKFETWLGSILNPGEPFYLIASSKADADLLIDRIARIGYEHYLKQVFIIENISGRQFRKLNLEDFRNKNEDFTVVDIRNYSEIAQGKIFENALVIPLPDLRERVKEIPSDKPIVVHCAAGYRSAAGISIIKNVMKAKSDIYDLGIAVHEFEKQEIS